MAAIKPLSNLEMLDSGIFGTLGSFLEPKDNARLSVTSHAMQKMYENEGNQLKEEVEKIFRFIINRRRLMPEVAHELKEEFDALLGTMTLINQDVVSDRLRGKLFNLFSWFNDRELKTIKKIARELRCLRGPVRQITDLIVSLRNAPNNDARWYMVDGLLKQKRASEVVLAAGFLEDPSGFLRNKALPHFLRKRFDEALDIAAGMSDEYYKTIALTEIITYLFRQAAYTPERKARLLELSQTIQDEELQSQVEITIASTLSNEYRYEEAIEMAGLIRSDSNRFSVLGDIVRGLNLIGQRQKALEVAELITDPVRKEEALQQIKLSSPSASA